MPKHTARNDQAPRQRYLDDRKDAFTEKGKIAFLVLMTLVLFIFVASWTDSKASVNPEHVDYKGDVVIGGGWIKKSIS